MYLSKGKIKYDKDVSARQKFRSFNCFTAKNILEYIQLMPAVLKI
jgi:hypothetical protein